ncbi:MAG TPA: glyceraldehyde 3-phosphate dehydrogenase NAD-binding domain-containing protein [Candidatus Paceibacterota bacterium]|nr:glyceraldehyde 3-phosphate dehydrogenase NAD-binding domain-containing protein [Candidatus Paceibacterota bacterium]
MNKSIRVAINGFGRIGRAFFRAVKDMPEIEVVAVNDLGDIQNLAYLLKYDSTYGRLNAVVTTTPESEGKRPSIIVDGVPVAVVQESDAAKLPWKEFDVDIVIESTGMFVACSAAEVHLAAGAKRVVLTAPFKKCEGKEHTTVLMGINEADIEHAKVTSNASCTTNAVSPLVDILNRTIGVEKAILNTTHAYTASQRLIDSPNKNDFREGRAAAMNLVPASTGASIAVTDVIKELEGKFQGISLRIPVVAGSIADVTFVAKRKTSVEEVNQILRDAAEDPRWAGIFTVTAEPLVSTDIVGEPYGSIADLSMTRVVDGDLVKVFAWYDNEAGYTNTLIHHVRLAGKHL